MRTRARVSWPIIGQNRGHVICLDQSEAGFAYLAPLHREGVQLDGGGDVGVLHVLRLGARMLEAGLLEADGGGGVLGLLDAT